MPKKKTRKSVSKRFKVTKTGKVMHAHQNQGHLKINRKQSRNRRGKEPAQLAPMFAKKIKQMLGV